MRWRRPGLPEGNRRRADLQGRPTSRARRVSNFRSLQKRNLLYRKDIVALAPDWHLVGPVASLANEVRGNLLPTAETRRRLDFSLHQTPFEGCP